MPAEPFTDILEQKRKKRSLQVLTLVFILICVAGTLAACSNVHSDNDGESCRPAAAPGAGGAKSCAGAMYRPASRFSDRRNS